MNEQPAILEFAGVEKSFFGVKVLKGVRFCLAGGRTLGLVGENGAGKSTLMNLLGGNLLPDAGGMRLDGRPFAPRNPLEATRQGIAFIHQELNLFANLSIAENLFVTDFPTCAGLPLIGRKRLRERAADLLAQVGLELSPDTLVERLSAGERQLVEIAKALGQHTRLVILDEPTTSLTLREMDRFFALLEQLRRRRLSLIYISHNLGDVLRICDDIVVLRDGEVVGQGAREEFDLDRLVSLMVGRSISQMFPARRGGPGPAPVLEARGLSQPGVIKNVSFALRRGEILGLAGLMGSGRSELARILFGLDRFARGSVLVAGTALRPSPRRSIRRRVAFLTENRREEGLCLEASIADNIALVTLPQRARRPLGWLDRTGLRRMVGEVREAVRLSPAARDEQAAKTLSGGNQQKAVLAKWLLAGPAVFILDEPTRGIDVGAKAEIYGLIQALADQGTALLMISSEIEELIGLCDRILVMSRGEICDEIHRAEFDRERILRAALREHGGRREGRDGNDRAGGGQEPAGRG